MKQPQLTAQQSKAARAALRVSQSEVAMATGVNRSQLALFEVEKYLLPSEKLKALRRYYEEGGHRFGNAKSAAPAVQPANDASTDAEEDADFVARDGYLVAPDLDPDEAQTLLQEIAANDERIEALAQEKAVRDWWWGDEIANTAERDEIVRRMAHNYYLVCTLQGRDPLLSGQEDTLGALVRELVEPAPSAPSAPKSYLDKLFF